MTTYIPIDDEQIDLDRPVTQLLAAQWRDNPLAIIEGAVDAPRLSIHAWPRLSVGDQVRGATPGGSADASNSPVVFARFAVFQTGAFRLKATISGSFNGAAGGNRAFRLTRVRNGVSSEFANYVYGGAAYSLAVVNDIVCKPFDQFLLSATCTIPTGPGMTVSACDLCTDGEDLLLFDAPTYVRNMSEPPT